jgi:hypothetical protein
VKLANALNGSGVHTGRSGAWHSSTVCNCAGAVGVIAMRDTTVDRRSVMSCWRPRCGIRVNLAVAQPASQPKQKNRLGGSSTR